MDSAIVVVGSMNIDFVVDTKGYPQRGETVLGKSVEYIPRIYIQELREPIKL